jgi:hypothetical protein
MAYKKKTKVNCKILWIEKNRIAIDYQGNGYVINIDKPIDENLKFINVYYDEEEKIFKI